MWKIVATNLTQKFNKRLIFSDISFEIASGQSLVFSGPNGSGKTTLMKIICQLIRPTGGDIDYLRSNKKNSPHELYPYIGLVGPYLQLYNNLTAWENYSFFARMRGLSLDRNLFKNFMNKMGLRGRELDELRTYSSGLLQRIKYVMALMHEPPILFLDEPTSNLDESGVSIVFEIMEKQKKNNILVLATNEPEELKFGEKQIKLTG
jgi:heme exporter protein A